MQKYTHLTYFAFLDSRGRVVEMRELSREMIPILFEVYSQKEHGSKQKYANKVIELKMSKFKPEIVFEDGDWKNPAIDLHQFEICLEKNPRKIDMSKVSHIEKRHICYLDP